MGPTKNSTTVPLFKSTICAVIWLEIHPKCTQSVSNMGFPHFPWHCSFLSVFQINNTKSLVFYNSAMSANCSNILGPAIIRRYCFIVLVFQGHFFAVLPPKSKMLKTFCRHTKDEKPVWLMCWIESQWFSDWHTGTSVQYYRTWGDKEKLKQCLSGQKARVNYRVNYKLTNDSMNFFRYR